MGQTNSRGNRLNNLPWYVKTIILAQSIIILIFTIGMYQEYLSNAYLQQYVIALLTSNLVADAMLSMVTMSVFALGTFMVLGSMSTSRKAGKDWRLMTESAHRALDMPSMPVLEVVQPTSKPRKPTSQTRRRKASPRTDEIFRSMTTYTESREE